MHVALKVYMQWNNRRLNKCNEIKGDENNAMKYMQWNEYFPNER